MNNSIVARSKSFAILWVMLVLVFGYSIFFNSCTQPKVVDTGMTAERQKAIEDSILKEKELEITKFWSTGYEYYKNKNYADAKKNFFLVLSLDPSLKLADKFHYKDIHGRVAQCYVVENKPDSTEWAYEEGIKYDDNNAYYHEMLGYLNRGKNLFDKSITHYEKAVSLYDEKPELYKTIGDLHYQQGNVDKAIESYESYIKIKPEDREVQEKYASMLRSGGYEDRAIEQKEKLLEDNPTDTNLMMELGKTYFNNYENNKALAMFKRLTAIEPENVEALQFSANSQMNLEMYDGAIESLKKIDSIRPNDVEIICAIANSYRMKNQFQTARNHARRARRANPQSGLPYITIGDIYSATAEHCANQKGTTGFDFNDKLVYELAHAEYRKAKKDPIRIEEANRLMRSLEPYLPTTADRHMNAGQKKAEGDCYKWIY